MINIVFEKPSGKEPCNYTFAKEYLYIRLLNIIKKGLESVLATRISYFVKTYSLLPGIHIRTENLNLVYLIFLFLSNWVTSIRSNEFTAASLPISWFIWSGSLFSTMVFLFYIANLLDQFRNTIGGLFVNGLIEDTKAFQTSLLTGKTANTHPQPMMNPWGGFKPNWVVLASYKY